MGWRCYAMISKDEAFLIRGALVFPAREYHSNLCRPLPTPERLHYLFVTRILVPRAQIAGKHLSYGFPLVADALRAIPRRWCDVM